MVTSLWLWSSAFYFLYYAAAAVLIPFLAIYYQSLGISESQIGLLAGIMPLIFLLGAPLWTGIADATRRYRLWFSITMIGSILLTLLISRSSLITTLIPSVAMFAFFSAPVMPLMDNATMNWLGKHHAQYGKIRLWGAIGWGVSAPLAGWVIEAASLRWIFWLYSALMLLSLLASARIPMNQPSSTTAYWNGVRILARDRHWILFLMLVFAGGVSLSAISSFLFVFMSELGADTTLMGLALTVATASELPMLFFSKPLLERLGARGLLVAAVGTGSVRALSYSFVTAAWMILPIQLLHGLSFSAMWGGRHLLRKPERPRRIECHRAGHLLRGAAWAWRDPRRAGGWHIV
jgi:PPP family 3-phenylpropionic acid transporter